MKAYIKNLQNNKYEVLSPSVKFNDFEYSIYNCDGVIILKPLKEGNTSIKKNVNAPQRVPLKFSDYRVVEDISLAKNLSYTLREDIKAGKIIGIKGFDGKYYVFEREYYSKIKSLIKGILSSKGDYSIDNIAKSSNEPYDAVRGSVEIMKEEGLLIEPSKNLIRLI